METKKKTGFGGLQRRKKDGLALQGTRLNSNKPPARPVEVGSSTQRTTRQSGRTDQLNMISKHSGSVVHGKENVGIKLYKRQRPWVTMNANVVDHESNHELFQSPADFQESLLEPFANRITKKKCSNTRPSLQVGNPQEACRKVTSSYKAGRSKDVVLGEYSHLSKKVAADRLVGEHLHLSFKDGNSGSMFCAGHKKSIVDTRCLISRGIDPSEAHSSECSVASCSSTSYPSYILPHQLATRPREDMDSCFDDAESSCALGYGKECGYVTTEEMAAEIHKLELCAYRSTMEALHASGPLSWEQEAMMTNLRMNLHISNDEHLLELRQLVSPQNF